MNASSSAPLILRALKMLATALAVSWIAPRLPSPVEKSPAREARATVVAEGGTDALIHSNIFQPQQIRNFI